jgi:hypothetical protein
VDFLESAQFVRRIDFDRRQRRRFVVHERRSGFQRRERAGDKQSHVDPVAIAPQIKRRDLLGGLIHEYYSVAA